MKILELENIHYNYKNGQTALHEISFTVNQGDTVSILGTNGSGKSTLLYLMQGLFPPSKGKLRIFGNGESLSQEARARISIMFQNSQAQLFSLSVWDELLFGPLQAGLTVPEAEKRAEDILKMLGIAHLKERSPWQLSGGEIKKVALGTCLSTNPDIYLLDEPTSGLDPRSQVELIRLIISLKKAGKTIITATHDLHMVSEISERAIVLGEDHRLLAHGSTPEILRDEELLLRANLIHEHEHRHGDIAHEHSHYGAHEHHEHPHGHEHSESDHGHSHEHSHEPGHVHVHGENKEGKKPETEFEKKIKILLEHWAEHNAEHARTYLEWAEKAREAGEERLSLILREISEESKKLDELFRKARKESE